MSSNYKVGIVETGTVVFRRATTTSISLGNDAVVDGITVASIDADGLLTYRPQLVSEIALANGVQVHGIRALYPSGDPYDAAAYPELFKPMLMLRSTDDGFAVAVQGSVAITNPTERFSNAYGAAAVVIPRDSIQLFWSVNGADRSWRSPSWGVYAGDASSFATHPGTMTTAIQRMAAALAGLLGGPIPD